MSAADTKLREDLKSTGCKIREDMSGCRRRVRMEVFPAHLEEIVAALRVAKKARAKVHTVSCGRNWGFGSDLPVPPNSVVINLSRMNRIRRLSSEGNTVEIEPGVTQGQLSDCFTKAGGTHFLNVTGAGLSASVLGNALERGIGYFGSRDQDLIGAEVLLASGETVKLGYGGHAFGACAPLGPALEGLLVQSGWAIVTAGTMKVSRRPELMGGAVLAVKNHENLQPVVAGLRDVLAEGWIDSVPHIFNKLRLETTFGENDPWPAWLAVVPLRGPKGVVHAAVAELGRRFDRLADIRTLNLELPNEENSSLRALQSLLGGQPIDLALFSMSKTLKEPAELAAASSFDPEKGNAGLIHVTPSLPLDAQHLDQLLGLVDRITARHGWGKLPLSLNLVSSRHGCLIISICFKRDSAIQKGAAKSLAQDILAQINAAGFRPYRLGLEQAAELSPFEAPLAGLCQRLQKALDPEGLLAPSRYQSLWTGKSMKGLRENPFSFLETVEREQRRTKENLCEKNLVLS